MISTRCLSLQVFFWWSGTRPGERCNHLATWRTKPCARSTSGDVVTVAFVLPVKIGSGGAVTSVVPVAIGSGDALWDVLLVAIGSGAVFSSLMLPLVAIGSGDAVTSVLLGTI